AQRAPAAVGAVESFRRCLDFQRQVVKMNVQDLAVIAVRHTGCLLVLVCKVSFEVLQAASVSPSPNEHSEARRVLPICEICAICGPPDGGKPGPVSSRAGPPTVHIDAALPATARTSPRPSSAGTATH